MPTLADFPFIAQTPRPDAVHLREAARHLYASQAQPGALAFDELTAGQQARWLDLARLAVRCSDVTAIRASHERAAGALAVRRETTLRSMSPADRRAVRFETLDVVRAFERSLVEGDHVTDQRALALQAEEHRGWVGVLATEVIQ